MERILTSWIGFTDVRASKGAEKDGQEILTPINLTSNFMEEQGGINITLVDNDNNDFMNSGDYFVCHVDDSGEYQLILDYVEQDRWDDEYEVVYSQSVSWIG